MGLIWVIYVLSKVCEGLLHELLEVGISAWPGYMDTMQSSMDKLHTKWELETHQCFYNIYLYPSADPLYISHVSLVLCVGMTRWACYLQWWLERTLWRTGSCWFATVTPPSGRPCTSLRSDSFFSNTYQLRKTSDLLLNKLYLRDLLTHNLIVPGLMRTLKMISVKSLF